MDVISKIQALLTNGYSVAVAVAATIAVLLKILTHLTKAMDWHDEHFVRKRLSRLKEIRSDAATPQLVRYLDGAIELEMFRIASGVSTSRAKMEYLLQLDQAGQWNRAQLRSVSKFLALQAGNEAPILLITLLDGVSAYVSATSAFLTLAVGVGYLTELVLTGVPLLWVLGLSLLGLAILLARYLGSDFIDYVIVKRTQEHLEHQAKATASQQ